MNSKILFPQVGDSKLIQELPAFGGNWVTLKLIIYLKSNVSLGPELRGDKQVYGSPDTLCVNTIFIEFDLLYSQS